MRTIFWVQTFVTRFAGAAAAALLCGGHVAGAQAPGPNLAPPLFADLTWRNVGPALFGGRVVDIEVARERGRPDQIYILPENGGVFKSNDDGASWTEIFGATNTMMSMGDIAVAPSNPEIVWIGTGSGLNPSYYWGEGVFKSVDGGRTWTNMGLRGTRHIGRVVIHPANPNIVFVAAAGRLWGPSEERGLFRTTDGGTTWKKVLAGDSLTGANDVLFDPRNPLVLFASLYQRQRNGFGGNGVGPGSGIYKSIDGGDHWTKLTRGLPSENLGRIGLPFLRWTRSSSTPTLKSAVPFTQRRAEPKAIARRNRGRRMPCVDNSNLAPVGSIARLMAGRRGSTSSVGPISR